MVLNSNFKNVVSQWNYVYIFILLGAMFLVLGAALINLQVVESANYKYKSENNKIRLRYEYPNRGVIFDRNGGRLAENKPSTDLVLGLQDYTEANKLDPERINEVAETIVGLIGDSWENAASSEKEYSSLAEYILIKFDEETVTTQAGYVGVPSEILIASNLDNEQTIKLKAMGNSISGMKLEEGSKRSYPEGIEFGHILGYTSLIVQEDIKGDAKLDYLNYDDFVAANGFRDIVGRLGIEKVYDQQLLGSKGVFAQERNAYEGATSDSEREFEPTVSGKNLYLSIDIEAQTKMHEIIEAGIEKHGATGGSGIIQDVETGELIVMTSNPGYDNNQFVGGISTANYKLLLEDPQLPLLNRSIGAQLPPGSTFKTLAAVGAYDSGAITKNTIYVSRSDYSFTNGVKFQEYRNNSYGPLNLQDAISRSSNIYFCETIRNWDIYELVKYYEAFGIGEYTGVDLYGETPGRLPSPQNKTMLAQTPGITWLEPIWYPEGDGCNTVIGQGITLVTPLQMSNWIAAIANGGTLNTPHLGVKFVDSDGNEEIIKYVPLNTNLVKKNDTLAVVREGMRMAVSGPKKSIVSLDGAKVNVAAKTGTAEFGSVNKDGIYEHTHAWVTGFFPYENPKYSFAILLEDGGESYYSAQLAREFIDWFAVQERFAAE